MDTYGLIGYPLGHSFSKGYFTEFFYREGIDAVYKNFELPHIEKITEILQSEPSLRGFNVTIPYKQQIFLYLTELDEAARTIGAVNVVKIIHDNGTDYLKGYNTDYIGFATSIRHLLKPHHTHALILGTGGASKAVEYALRQMGIETLFVSRTSREGIVTYEELSPELMARYTLIVNTTPLGMHPHTSAADTYSTTSSTTPRKPFSYDRERLEVPLPAMVWRCSSNRPQPLGRFGLKTRNETFRTHKKELFKINHYFCEFL